MSRHFFSSHASGFTIIELSISLLIVSLIMGGIVSVENQKLRVGQREEMVRKLDAISTALYNYRLINNKLPCPGNSSLGRYNVKFGLEADPLSPEACNTGVTVSSNLNTSSNEVFGGSVPIRSLGLADDYAFDPWGNQYSYFVATKATRASNFTGEYGTAGVGDDERLNVRDESGATVQDNILAIVISHGPNGHGAYNVAGRRISAGSTNDGEQRNCMCDANAAPASPIPSFFKARIQRVLPTSATDFRTNYDDTVRFYNQAFFYTPAEKAK